MADTAMSQPLIGQEPETSEKMLSVTVKKNDITVKMSLPKSFCSILKLWDSIRISVFVIGTAVIMFASARNTITWYLQQFWGASGDYWQRKWESVYMFFEGNEMSLAMWGTCLVLIILFWVCNGLLLILDLTGRPQFLFKYKIQAGKNNPVDKQKLVSAILQVLFNQFVVSLPIMYLSFHAMKWRGCSFGPELPTFHWVLCELIVFTVVEEIMFYYSHRLLHHPRLYRHIHKKHHEWTAPVGVTALYAHPVEHLVSNLLPPGVGPFLMGSHIATAIMWFTLAIISTTIAHCGYHFPFLPSPEAHDFHHLKFVNNFGMLGVLDHLHGTDELFRASKIYERHFLLLGFVPVSQQFPDDEKKLKEVVQPDTESRFMFHGTY